MDTVYSRWYMVTGAIDVAGVFERLQQHLIGFVSVIVGKSEIRGVQIVGVDLLLLNKRKNLHGLSGFRSNFLQVIVVDQDVVSLFVFVALTTSLRFTIRLQVGQNSSCFKRVWHVLCS
jgi:hypothetical protein